MLNALILIVGLTPPTLAGWLLLRITEGKTPVLLQWERWIAGFVLGCILNTFAIFLTEILHIGSFSFLSMLLTQIVLLGILGTLCWKNQYHLKVGYKLQTTNYKLITWQKIVIGVLGAWTLLKLYSGLIFLMGPAYFDDTISNWNMRGKMFFADQHLTLDFNPFIGSYPQSVPLTKTWLSSIAGQWREGLVNAPHFLWYLSALALLYFALRRRLSLQWSLLGVYILSSVPLFLVHGSVAYADCFLATVIFLAVTWLWGAVEAKKIPERLTYLRLTSIASALLIFTKNEALLLHLTTMTALCAATLFLLKWKPADRRSAVKRFLVPVACVLIPWVAFKWLHGLGFGNAKDVSGLALAWQPGVLRAIVANTFFEGNWSLLPVLFAALLGFEWRRAFRSTLIVPVAFVLIVIIGQLPIYLFTSLSVEALNQTGYARGLIHLVPLIVLSTTLLLAEWVSKRDL